MMNPMGFGPGPMGVAMAPQGFGAGPRGGFGMEKVFPVVRLRGLPFNANEFDILDFFQVRARAGVKLGPPHNSALFLCKRRQVGQTIYSSRVFLHASKRSSICGRSTSRWAIDLQWVRRITRPCAHFAEARGGARPCVPSTGSKEHTAC